MPLSPPDRTVLPNAPLVVVLAQVRFDPQEASTATAAVEAMLPAASRLGLEAVTQVTQHEVTFAHGPDVPVPGGNAVQRPAGWQFARKDGQGGLTLLPDQLTLEMRAYASWEEFSAAWGECVVALMEAVGPSLTTRVGLRYVNRMTPRDVTSVAGLGAPGLVDVPWLGPVVGSGLAEFVVATEGRATLSFPDGTDALVQHGTVLEADRPTFVLDIDCFRAQAARFAVREVLMGFDALNERSLQIFQAAIGETLREQFGPGGAA